MILLIKYKTMENINVNDFANDIVNDIRKQIKDIAKSLKVLRTEIDKNEVSEKEDRGEVMANLTIAYRHLEDACMRLDKVLQAQDGGVSVYDKETTVGE